MRSKNRIVEVRKAVNLGKMPTFLAFMHRHLEKENSLADCTVAPNSRVDFTVPVDLFQLTISDSSLLKGIESVTLTYEANR